MNLRWSPIVSAAAAPLRRDLSIPVDVVNVSSQTLRTHEGTVRHFADGVYDIELTELAPDLEDGVRAVLNLRRPARRVTATVIRRDQRRILVQERRAVMPDNRIYPRLVGGIPLRYQVVGDDVEGALRAWRDDEAPPSDGWIVPDPFMNFSVGGVRFHDDVARVAGDLLLCELGVAHGTERWRAVGEVIRVVELEDDDDGAYSIAVQFVDLDPGARDALTAYTLQLQRAGL